MQTTDQKITPIFGLGYMRSGTTLLFNIIKNHPDIFTRCSEPKLFASLPVMRSTYPDLGDDDTLRGYIAYIANVARFGWSLDKLEKPLIEDEDFNKVDMNVVLNKIQTKDYVPIVNNIYGQMAQKSGKNFWYVKTQVVFVDDFLKWIPEARFIEIVRDPRDVLASKKKDKQSVWEPGKYSEVKRPFKELEKAFDPVWDSLSWKSEITAGMKIKESNPDIIHSLRYEDLVGDPEKCTKVICDFLSIDFYESQLDVPKRNTSLWQNKPKGIGTQSVEKWKRILTPEEAAVCQFLTKAQLKAKNYEIESVKISWYKIPIIFFQSIGEFFQRLNHRKKMGGKNYLRSILYLYWRKFRKIF